MSLIPEDEYLTNDLFIRLSWCLYFQSPSPSVESQFNKDVENLISITNLNKQTLIHTLYYLYLLVNHKPFLYSSSSSKLSSTFQSSSRLKLLSSSNRKNQKELYELLIILFMISNKANDDSSYTLKTWSNLTPLNNSTLKKKELVVLKKIQYNVFLKNDEYYKWCNQLYQQAIKYQLVWDQQQPALSTTASTSASVYSPYNYPLTPKSPAQETFYQQNVAPVVQPPQVQQVQIPQLTSSLPIPQVSQPQQSVQAQQSYIPSYAHKRPFTDFNSTPVYNYHENYTKKPQYDSVYNTPTKMPLISSATMNYNLLTPLKSGVGNEGYYYDYPGTYLNQPIHNHPLNCSCCCLTNFTNSYHNSMKSVVKL